MTDQSKVLELFNEGIALSDSGRNEDALLKYDECFKIFNELYENEPSDNSLKQNIATVLMNMGVTLSNLGRNEDAISKYEESFKMRNELYKDNPTDNSLKQKIATVLMNMGVTLSNLGRNEDALLKYDECFKIFNELYENDPTNNSLKQDIATVLMNMGDVLSSQENLDFQKKYGKPEDKYKEAYKLYLELSLEEPNNYTRKKNVANVLKRIGKTLENEGNYEQAINKYKESQKVYKEITVKDRTYNDFLYEIDLDIKSVENTIKLKEENNSLEAEKKELSDQLSRIRSNVDFEKVLSQSTINLLGYESHCDENDVYAKYKGEVVNLKDYSQKITQILPAIRVSYIGQQKDSLRDDKMILENLISQETFDEEKFNKTLEYFDKKNELWNRIVCNFDNILTEEQKRGQKHQIAKRLLTAFGIETILLFILIMCNGLIIDGIHYFSVNDSTLNILVGATVAQFAGMLYAIVNNLYPKNENNAEK